MVNKLIQAPNHSISQHESDDLCCTFLHHFQGKLDVLCGTFGEEPTISSCVQTQSTQSLTTFTLTNPSLIAYLIQKSNSSSSRLDPAPTFFLKHYPGYFCPNLTPHQHVFHSFHCSYLTQDCCCYPYSKKKQIWIL